jgi:hypothetical protein
LNQTKRAAAEGKAGAALGAKQVANQWECGAGDIGEQECRSARSNDASVDLRDLEIRIDRRVDHHEITVAPDLIEEGSEVGKCDVAQRRSKYPKTVVGLNRRGGA